MKKLILLFVVIFLLSTTKFILSQEMPDAENRKKQETVNNSLEKGKWALQFTIDQNFTLSNFEGSIISIKKQLSDKRALRLGLSLEFYGSNDESTRINSIDTNKPQFGKGGGYSADVFPTYIFYMNPKDVINLYFGAGITAGASYRWTESREDAQTAPSYFYRYYREYSYGGGLTGTIGVEFFPIKNFSIIAEYFSSFIYAHYKSTSIEDYPGDYSRIESSGNQFEFSGKRVNFGLSVYF